MPPLLASSYAAMVSTGKLIDPGIAARVFVSPRKRAQTTYGLLFGFDVSHSQVVAEKVTVTEETADWNYGDYEGLLTSEIQDYRRAKGLDSDCDWDIWRDGCEGEESVQEVTNRLDHLITKINDIHRSCIMHGEAPADVVLLAHGHILRTFVKRWLRIPMADQFSIMMPSGAIGILSYDDHMINKPALLVGLAPQSEKGIAN
ncbi:phosphoglycerate mutase [Xylaria bambusicola]|uniref:phosphoglycerate mutase n=1 Tax=Xylaria bambusicola TaxID=326684 RepID=UPI00200755F8|nr:phosphoglycerate mutase [Xylaria bambusicola]KAI0506715.1 phosphoglycerate mutase [Xylaria bambusicola]